MLPGVEFPHSRYVCAHTHTHTNITCVVIADCVHDRMHTRRMTSECVLQLLLHTNNTRNHFMPSQKYNNSICVCVSVCSRMHIQHAHHVLAFVCLPLLLCCSVNTQFISLVVIMINPFDIQSRYACMFGISRARTDRRCTQTYGVCVCVWGGG